jgi:predicted nucleotidyltransferase
MYVKYGVLTDKRWRKNMAKQTNKQIQTLTNRLIKKFRVKQIFVFGSYAYGNPDSQSDIDLCIVADMQNKRKIDFIRDIRRELMDFIFSPLDILVYNEKEFEERANLRTTLEYKILTQGLCIYG